MVMPQQNMMNPYGNPFQQQMPEQKKFSIPTGLFWAILIILLGISAWLIFF